MRWRDELHEVQGRGLAGRTPGGGVRGGIPGYLWGCSCLMRWRDDNYEVEGPGVRRTEHLMGVRVGQQVDRLVLHRVWRVIGSAVG